MSCLVRLPLLSPGSGISPSDAPHPTLGEVIEGFDLVKAIEALGSASGTPKRKIVIAASGTV